MGTIKPSQFLKDSTKKGGVLNIKVIFQNTRRSLNRPLGNPKKIISMLPMDLKRFTTPGKHKRRHLQANTIIRGFSPKKSTSEYY